MSIIRAPGTALYGSAMKVLVLLAGVIFSVPAHAFDLNGRWITGPAVCDKMFEKNDEQIAMAKDSDVYGSGFVVDGNKIRGKIASCDVKARKQDGALLNLVAVCSTDI
jgi:hypothetical protein